MELKNKLLAQKIYLILASLFIASLVVCNLIFQKFFYWEPFGLYRFELSVGMLAYPVTFLITDVLSEIYGKNKANQVVIAGVFASFFSMFIVLIAESVPAINSPNIINDQLFSRVFGLSPLAVLASMLAYLFAQFLDIRIFHFWKKMTKGNHLWLRNNFSTFPSQFVDTLTVILLLSIFNILPWHNFWKYLISGVVFKMIIAALDTPFLYLIVYFFQKKFNLKKGEELVL